MADYRDENPDQTAAFIERVADHLRSPERLDPSFDGRLIDKVRMEPRSVHPATQGEASWWRTQRVVRFSPLGAIALAAGGLDVCGAVHGSGRIPCKGPVR